jgi:pSer/pThr/pTyr-binding forkhead associated (FHA) protein
MSRKQDHKDKTEVSVSTWGTWGNRQYTIFYIYLYLLLFISFNGTYVNSSKVNKDARIVLKNNDLISLRVPEVDKQNDWKRPGKKPIK